MARGTRVGAGVLHVLRGAAALLHAHRLRDARELAGRGDATQQTFTALYTRWPRVSADRIEATRGACCLNTCMSVWRARGREVLRDEVPDGGVREDHDERLVLLAALSDLLPRDRAVLALRYLEDLSVACGRLAASAQRRLTADSWPDALDSVAFTPAQLRPLVTDPDPDFPDPVHDPPRLANR